MKLRINLRTTRIYTRNTETLNASHKVWNTLNITRYTDMVYNHGFKYIKTYTYQQNKFVYKVL